MKMAGLNAVDVYVEWSGHEPEPGRYLFHNEYDLELFLEFVQDLDLLVLFRPGPYICAERDNGGLPYWLLRKNASMVYRTSDPSFMAEVTRWFDRLLPLMKPYLYEYGGPIILVQVENEYGAYFACDKKYMRDLASLLRRHLGHSVPLFLSNQADESHFRCDRVSGILPTVNMNAHVPVWKAQEVLSRVYPRRRGPLVIAEYYTAEGTLKNATSRHPMTFEEFGQAHGYVVYMTRIQGMSKSPAILEIRGMKDRGYVSTGREYSLLGEGHAVLSVPIEANQGDVLSVIVENMGRTNFGKKNHDPKHTSTMALTWTLLLLTFTLTTSASERCFRVDYENNVFLKDDEPFQFVSGSFHYFRVLKDSWKDRLIKMKNGGLNVVQTYVEWSGHEPEPQQYNFEGNYDIETFLKLAQEVGLFVVLRPGPYISAERDNGGLPYWLLRENPRMVYRSFDPTFMLPVDRWFHYFLPMIQDYMYHNGGPIIMVQVENEYGEYKECDCRYMEHLVYIFLQHLGTDTVLYRQDYPLEENYICDEARQTFVSGSFKYNETIADVFDIMNKSQGNEGPMLVSEYYPGGWQSHWGWEEVTFPEDKVIAKLEEMLSKKASVNFYMYVGGTNFGFTNGNRPPPLVTSYDYGSPISECGDTRPIYHTLRQSINKFLPLPEYIVIDPEPRLNLGSVTLSESLDLVNVLSRFRRSGRIESRKAKQPLTFEDIGQCCGYVVYSTVINFDPDESAKLSVPGLKDRGYLLTKTGVFVMSSEDKVFEVEMALKRGDSLSIVVENEGRINRGRENHDPKKTNVFEKTTNFSATYQVK
ncbi:beta-galactosidase precursor, putative [Ixodes scapularis]|uniref:Beta-galactosidase n=1 Tax=Ixodes scapularis TaxID=6945 RepID=B7PW87_IXOSC|nr:beta-galactosidase precursor, putative [Ixodes scapularis]|eukprot:XP_002409405.1 beta-galactosidase precursor, putative [Ixodes scapularis]